MPLLGLTLITIIHEAAHGVAVLLQGGKIVSFRWWPTLDSLGKIKFTFIKNSDYSIFLVSMAPYFLWITIAAISAVLSFSLKNPSFKVYSTIFLWLFFMPVGDIGLAALPYVFFSNDNDFYQAFGPPTVLLSILIIFAAVIAVISGWFVHKNLYRDDSLSVKTYLCLAIVTVCALCIL